MDAAEYLIAMALRMKVGEVVRITDSIFREAFPYTDWHQLLNRPPPIDRFLERLPGANYGTFRIETDFESGCIILSRHEESAVRVREDWRPKP